jgi:hypothetical protein
MTLVGGAFSMGTGPGSSMRFSHTRGRIQGSPYSGVYYPSPFFDVAHTYLPVTVKQLFRWCRYYFLTNPIINAAVFKLAEYPVTELIIDHENPEVVRLWTEFFQDHLRYRPFQIECGLDYYCLAGSTRVVTRDGVLPIQELAGRDVDVLSEGGVYRHASFHFYGRQRLWEVHTTDGVVLATEEHRWPTWSHIEKKIVWCTTKSLAHKSVPRVVAPRPAQNDDFYCGFRHGVVFGDGTVSNGGRQAHLILYTAEKRELAKYFEGHCSSITEHHAKKYLGVYGLPPAYKKVPDEQASAAYWYGFTCGLLATDGSVSKRGDSSLSQKDPAVLLEISKRLPWFGMLGGRVSEYCSWNSFTKREETFNVLTLKKQTMSAQDFLRPDQRARFERMFKPTGYGRFVLVSKVVPTDRVEPVYCCIEPETHSFVIEHGMLTGNCYGNAMTSIFYPFVKYLTCRDCGFTEEARKIRDHWTFTNIEYRLTCPKCGHTSDATAWDYYYRNAGGVRLIRWNCENVEISYNEVTGESKYFYNIPPTVRNDIVIGKKDTVEGLPQVFIQAMKERKGIVFSKDNFFHFKRPTLANEDRGWGIPLILPVLKDTFYLQLMKKAQESILLEHIVPLRVLFPQPGSGASDPFTTVNLAMWREQVANEIARWRSDSAYIPILPLPIGNQTIGGDGRALLLTQEIQTWSEQIINGMHVPLEFIKGGLSYAGTNVSMRMLENQFIGYIYRHKQQVRWVMKNIAAFMGWPEVKIRFRPFKMADDIQRKAYMFQLNQAGKISDTTLLADSDLDQKNEDEVMLSELDKRLESTKKQQLAMAEIQAESQVIMSKAQAKAQQVMMQAQQAPMAPGEPGGPEMTDSSPGGQEAAGALPGGMQSSLNGDQRLGQQGQPQMGADIQQMAQMIAQQYVTLTPQQQQMALQNLQAQSPELAQLVQQYAAQLQQQQGQAEQGQAGQPQVDMRPLPDARSPRRLSASV